ncbi:hypothetical protein [Streptomyces sennicomposti]|uniref:hypothetical protein n=1 Tax=Streptomyces sennicomposti TaxID=2873384 RepID=UPI001CA70BC1|nr:hypothetical protein [Streptomyces sennicomposti]MBY8869353.1 hypothetical protein [Streptomyces sennicomposti]
MLKVMLCGAADTNRVLAEFTDVVSGFGGTPLHYQSGRILHMNAAGSNWRTNSQMTVDEATLCVFVIVEEFGEITWTTELKQARAEGKPFLLFCLDATYVTIEGLRRHVPDLQHVSGERERSLVALMNDLESDSRQETVISFTYGSFGTHLRGSLANLFYLTLRAQQARNRRAAVARMLEDSQKLSRADYNLVAEIATDELEEKALRKRALLALASGPGFDNDDVVDVLSSAEQGVQRLATDHLAELYRVRPPDPEFFDHCVQLANASDDVGMARRMLPALLDLDIATAIEALASLDLAEVGLRRRVVEQLISRESQILDNGLAGSALTLIARCLEETHEVGWKKLAKELRSRLIM